jgi:hypothetical protein
MMTSFDGENHFMIAFSSSELPMSKTMITASLTFKGSL